jgi:hypothetical protein
MIVTVVGLCVDGESILMVGKDDLSVKRIDVDVLLLHLINIETGNKTFAIYTRFLWKKLKVNILNATSIQTIRKVRK